MNLLDKLFEFICKISKIGLPCGSHITRYYMYEHIKRIKTELRGKSCRVLSISHSANLADLLDVDAIEIIEANYPDHNILSLNFEDNLFDLVISDQVLEHVEGSPQQAIDECYRVLKVGGYALHTTCLMNPVHGFPYDFWRFTPKALSLLHKDWSGIIDSGGWGNFETLKTLNINLRFGGIPHLKLHPLHKLATKNDPRWLIVTWILARK